MVKMTCTNVTAKGCIEGPSRKHTAKMMNHSNINQAIYFYLSLDELLTTAQPQTEPQVSNEALKIMA